MAQIKENWQQYAAQNNAQSVKRRAVTHVNACLVLRKEDKVLLHLRKNTGYADGFYGLISGHVEEHESATQAVIREAFEEAGIKILPKHLKFMHMCHRKTDRCNIDLFFECSKWDGDIENKEPDKCAALEFVSLDRLPENTIEHIAEVLKSSLPDTVYSECGWDN